MARIPHFILYSIRLFLLVVLLVTWSSGPEEFHEIPPLVHTDNVVRKKRNFIAYMKPIIKAENDRIREQREDLVTLHQAYLSKDNFSRRQQRLFDQLCQYYRIQYSDPVLVDVWMLLFKRVDIVPLELALAQSAAESAWGTSRFARLGNSFFGQWIYRRNRGMKPIDIAPGEKHRVARFKSVPESARSYMRNLNTHWAYQGFRQMRYDQRQSGEKLDGLLLAEGLLMYSQRRGRYVEDIKTIIRVNRDLIHRD